MICGKCKAEFVFSGFKGFCSECGRKMKERGLFEVK